MKKLIFLFSCLPLFISAQCWESLDIDGDTNSMHFAIRSDKSLWKLTANSIPVQMGFNKDWSKCFSSMSSTFAIATDSTLWGYGDNFYGELGIGNTNPQLNFIQLNPHKWINLTTSWGRTTAIKSDGTMWFWGESWPNSVLLPSQVGIANNWKTVCSEYDQVCAIKNNGTLWHGTAGNNLVQVGLSSDWKSILLNWDGLFAIKNNGTLWKIDLTNNSINQVGSDSNWELINGKNNIYAIKNNGTLWYWDDPSSMLTTLPDLLNPSNYFTEITSGVYDYIYAITTNGELYRGNVTWGTLLPVLEADLFASELCTSACFTVFNDIGMQCSTGNGIEGIDVIISPGNYIATTNQFGQCCMPLLPDGNYSATVDTTNLNWASSCPTSISFSVVNGFDPIDSNYFFLYNTNPCTDPDVSIYAPFLRPCLPNQMLYVQACNEVTATNVLSASYVDVELDPLMTVTSSSLPYSVQSSNVYRFQTGNINPGQCVNFSIATTIGSPIIDCASLLGQTLCMDATLFPVQSCVLDTVPSNPPVTGGGTLNGFPQPCTLPWDQSSLSVDGWCANDSIYFTITNTGQPGGGDMECYSPMWITVDGVVTYTDSIMIPGGQTITLSFPGDGQTWILNASQHPLHPGNSNPNAHVEACGDSTNFTPGLVNEVPLNDADPVVDIYCGTVTGSYDPNDKTGYPTGLTDQKYIQPNQQLQYVIRFQNTGTDTAFTVVIRDTLDTDLNIFTVTPGVSSHSYTFKMYGSRVLEWTFDNINLPDSTTDQAGSNGFATFHVEQVSNLSPGTEITNDADIYFDFNAPITTNTTIHRIYEGFVAVADLEEMIESNTGIVVYPNPSNGKLTILMEKAYTEQTYCIFDQQGRTVKTGKLDGKQTVVDLNIYNGMYFLMIGQEVVKVQVVN